VQVATPSQRLLDALKSKEKNYVHELRRRQQPQPGKVEKDW
jgi:hypothetical protein